MLKGSRDLATRVVSWPLGDGSGSGSGRSGPARCRARRGCRAAGTEAGARRGERSRSDLSELQMPLGPSVVSSTTPNSHQKSSAPKRHRSATNVIAKAMNQWGEGFPTSRCSYNQTPQERCLTKRQTKLQCAAVAQQVLARASQGSRPSKV